MDQFSIRDTLKSHNVRFLSYRVSLFGLIVRFHLHRLGLTGKAAIAFQSRFSISALFNNNHRPFLASPPLSLTSRYPTHTYLENAQRTYTHTHNLDGSHRRRIIIAISSKKAKSIKPNRVPASPAPSLVATITNHLDFRTFWQNQASTRTRNDIATTNRLSYHSTRLVGSTTYERRRQSSVPRRFDYSHLDRRDPGKTSSPSKRRKTTSCSIRKSRDLRPLLSSSSQEHHMSR